MKTKNYTVRTDSSAARAQVYAEICQQGRVGEMLIRNGAGGANFTAFIARYACRTIEAGSTEADLALALESLGASNGSAVGQVLVDLLVTPEGEKEMSLTMFWASQGLQPKRPVNLAMFKF